jgi:Zn finger protein HypA/HybF involved in hydrogenase expression
MHELSIALSLVEAICDELPRLGPVRVQAVHVRVGSLSGVATEALAFAFDVATDDSPIAGARLDIEKTPGRELELTALEVIDGAADCRSPKEHLEEERRRGRGAA